MKTIRIYCFIVSFVAALMMTVDAFGQGSATINGKVKDSYGEPVVGAVVMVEGNNTSAAVTGGDGSFSMKIPAGASALVVQCLGYEEGKVALTQASSYQIVLKEDHETLERVVVVGYGTMRESDITGSVTNVKIDENDASRSFSVDKMLKGRAAGVHVVSNSAAPGAGFNIKIRGNSSFNGGGEPLYVVDGVILNSTSDSNPTMMSKSTGNYEEETNGLLGIDPQDIASMEILKDASATAIYGAMGANGVVLITTKMAEKNKPVIRFNSGVEISTPVRKIDMLDLAGFTEYMEASNCTTYNKVIYAAEERDWQDYVSRNAVNQRYYVSVANKVKNTAYVFSMSYNNVQGIVKQTGMNQFKARLNLDQKVSDRLSLGLKVNVSRVASDMMQGASSEGMTSNTSFIRAVINGRPYLSYAMDEDEDASGFKEDYGAGADRWLNDYSDSKTEYRVIPNFNLDYKILPWLTYKFTTGADFRVKTTTKWKGPYVTTDAYWALAAMGSVQRLSYNFDNMFMFDKKFGDHQISGTLGSTFIGSDYIAEVTDGWNIEQYMAHQANINSAPFARFSYDETQAATLSFLARAVYSYKGRYILTATMRRDGSSRFSRENRYSNFPSFAAAWRVNEEPWFPSDKISTLKLRAGWGRVGNQAISSYQTLSNYNSVLFPDHSIGNENKTIIGVRPSNLANANLKWETTEQYNAGIDLKLNRNRLSFTLDVYDKNTFDLLQTVSVPATTGFDTMWMNLGTINNRGIEFSMDATLVKKQDFEWSVFGNIAHNENKIVSIGLPSTDGKAPFFYGKDIGNANYCKAPVNIFIEGQPMGLFYGLKTDGLVQEGETGPGLTEGTTMKPGGIKYIDLNGNGYVDTGTEDKTIIGDPNPDFTYGFGTSLSWKRFSLDVQCDGTYGNDIANINLIQETDLSRTNMNIRTEAFRDRWTPENTGAKYPAIGVYESAETKFFSDRFVEDGSFLRISNVTLSYSAPLKSKHLKGLDFALAVSNLHVFTSYSGFDPEVSSFGGNMMKMGVDYGSYPSARTYSFDVKFTF